MSRRGDAWTGFVAGLPVATGYLPVAFAFGLVARRSGLGLGEALGLSAIVYSGATQFMAVGMRAAGAGLVELILTALLLGSRHVVWTAALAQRMPPLPRPILAALGFFVTDETFAVASVREGPLRPGFALALLLTAYASWVTGSGAGFLLGAALPERVARSLGIALYALFIGLLTPALRRTWRTWAVVSAGGAASWAIGRWVGGGWPILAATGLAAALGAWLDASGANSPPEPARRG